MSKSFFLSLFIFFSIYSFGQIDIGISEIKVIQPQTYVDGDEIILGDTIGQLEITIFNYSNQAVSGSDLPNGAIEFQISYNGATKIISALLLGSIAANSPKVEKIPEYWPPFGQHLLPPFPSTLGNLMVCSKTRLTTDADPSNDEKCISLNIVTEPSTFTKDVVKKEEINLLINQKNLLIETPSPLQKGQVFIYNLVRQTLIENNFYQNSTSQTINLASLISGLYILELRDETGLFFTKMIFLE